LALPAAAVAETGGAGQFEEAVVGSHSPFARQGMWIWYVDQSQGGSVPAIIAQAKRNGIGTTVCPGTVSSGVTWAKLMG
jgi:hypothetical protein